MYKKSNSRLVIYFRPMYTCKKPENFHQYFGVENGYTCLKKYTI